MARIELNLITLNPIALRGIKSRVIGVGDITWADQMLASYRTLNPEQATYFDGAGAAVQTEFLARLQPGGYLQNTFGPTGQNKTVCDFVFVLKTVGNIITRTMAKTGATLRWDIDGTVTTQNNLPAHTLAGAGILTCSTTDGWTGLTAFYIDTNQFSGTAPNWTLPSVTDFRIFQNQFSGTAPNWNLPSVTKFWIFQNQFSGTAPNWNLPSVTEFRIDTNQFSGTAPNWSFPSVTDFRILQNNFSGTAPNWSFPNVTTFWIYQNQFSGTAPNWSFPSVTDFRIYQNNFSGTAPNWNLPSVTKFWIYQNQFSGTAPNWTLPSVTDFRISGNQFSSVDAPLASITKVTDLQAQNNGLSQAAVDAAFAAIHGARASYTGTSPALQIHGTNAAASGTFQANCPTPATGKEQWYHLVNDPCTEGFVKWTVTANS